MLSIYFLVMLHSIVPHFHGSSDCISVDAVTPESNHHHHHEGNHHDHDSEEGILHALGHLFNGFHHLDMGEEHLTHVGTQIANFDATILLTVANICHHFSSEILFIKEGERKNYAIYSAPPLEQILNSALPLRAPPALV